MILSFLVILVFHPFLRAIVKLAMKSAPLSVVGFLSMAHAAEVPIGVHVAQSGAFAGIRNTLHTVWLPPNQAFAKLTGRITLAGNHPGFREALIMLGYAGQNASECTRMDGSVIPGMPTLTRLWAGILKTNDRAPVSVPVEVDLPAPVAPPDPATGVCLETLVSAGYPFLRRDMALYTSTEVDLRVTTAPAFDRVITFGMGGEFRLAGDPATPEQVYVGIQVRRPMILDYAAVSVSAAPVTGAPAGSGWGGPVRGRWDVGTDFVVVHAPSCEAAHFAGHPAGPDFSVLRSATPAAVARLPPGGVPVLHVPLASQDMVAAQATRFYQFGTPGWRARLAVGDCLLVYHQATVWEGPGQIDVENQSTVYLRAAPISRP